uniref:Uncharacterized protein n=1 Tax=Trypanosoma congolense (strain IL3000) TaxID=1068625 RepID=G0V037_TRYCI|nr:hypothetical protein, unlikely [Trypanosoma congolense IL3000]
MSRCDEFLGATQKSIYTEDKNKLRKRIGSKGGGEVHSSSNLLVEFIGQLQWCVVFGRVCQGITEVEWSHYLLFFVVLSCPVLFFSLPNYSYRSLVSHHAACVCDATLLSASASLPG